MANRAAPVVVKCSDGRVSLQADQADAFRRSGVIVGRTRPRCRLSCREFERLLGERSRLSVCDFCAARGSAVWWDFPANDYDLPGGGRSVGAWRACEPCAELIELDAREALARRAAMRNGRPVSIYGMVHGGFWAHRQSAAPQRVEVGR